MRPFYSETKSEYWFPVKETGGMVDATPSGTLNLVSINDSLLLSFCPNIPIQECLKVLAKYYNEEEKARRPEEGMTENRPNSNFGILIRAIRYEILH